MSYDCMILIFCCPDVLDAPVSCLPDTPYYTKAAQNTRYNVLC